MAASAFVALGLAGGDIFFSIAEREQTKIVNEQMLKATSSASLEKVKSEDLSGFVVDILCDMNAAESFCGVETEAPSLSKMAYKRNGHFENETGAILSVTPTADFYRAACNDILSGTFDYNVYAADAANSLSHLLSAGHLHDVSESEYIDTSKEWFDGAVMDSLSIYGGQYLISSAAADARRNACVIVYNRDSVPQGMEKLSLAVLDGEFTLEAMLEYSRAAYLFDEMEENSFYGTSLGEEDIFPLLSGAGASFVSTTKDSIAVEPLANLRVQLDKVTSLVRDESVRCGTKDFSNSHSLFSVKKISEIAHLRDTVGNIGILPLPKLDKESEYHGYVDLEGAVMMALPNGALDKAKVEYALDRFARLSDEYISPYFKAEAAASNADDEAMLEIVFEGATSDLSSLFGYGDIGQLFADVALGEEKDLTLEYYNRKTLYEKAISIIEKRFAENKEK